MGSLLFITKRRWITDDRGNKKRIEKAQNKSLESLDYILETIPTPDFVEITGQIQSGGFSLSEQSYQELKKDYLALVITVVDIADGAAYLFEKEPLSNKRNWKAELELEQLRHILEREEKSVD